MRCDGMAANKPGAIGVAATDWARTNKKGAVKTAPERTAGRSETAQMYAGAHAQYEGVVELEFLTVVGGMPITDILIVAEEVI